MQTTEALELYLDQLRADGRSPHTIAQYRRHILLLADWLRDAPIESLDPTSLAVFLGTPHARLRPDGREKKPTALNALRSSLRTFFRFTHAAGYTPSNPARLLRRALCTSPEPRGLSRDEENRLEVALETAPDRDRALFRLMLRAGIRLGSVLAIEVEDVDLDDCSIRLRRTKFS